jgi:hypothetical protein
VGSSEEERTGSKHALPNSNAGELLARSFFQLSVVSCLLSVVAFICHNFNTKSGTTGDERRTMNTFHLPPHLDTLYPP